MINKYITLFFILLSVSYSYGQCSPDVTSPSITCLGNITVACPHIIGNMFSFQTSIAPTTSDNCGAIVSQTYTLTGASNATSPATGINDASSEIFLAGITTVTYVIKDAANNSASCSFTVTVNDFTQPAVTCPSNLILSNSPGECYAQVTQTQLGFPAASDNCNGISTILSGINLIDQAFPLLDYYEFPIGTTSLSWTVSDLAGNTSNCIQTVTVNDTENPIVDCVSDINITTVTGQCSAYVTIPVLNATDNCSVGSITNNQNGGGANASGTYPIGTTTVTFTVFDSSNNMTTCSMDVIVTNSQNPTIALLGANTMTLEACDTFIEPGATANDTCSGNITSDIVIDYSGLINNVVGTYSVLYTVTNANGNSTQVNRTVNVVDTTLPTLTLTGPNPLTIGDCSTYTELGAVAIDPCFGDISDDIQITSSVDVNTLGTYVVTYNITDTSGNPAASITRTVNVVDVNPPLITLVGPNPLILEACDTYEEFGATALEPCFNVNVTGSIVIDASSVNTSIPGFYIVTYNVMDANGNVAIEVIRDIEVIDTVTPTITCPPDITVDNDPGDCGAVVDYTIPVGVDNCPVTTVQTSGLASGSTFPIGTTINTFEVSDDNGITETCSFEITVTDTEIPIANCTNISIELEPTTGMVTITPSDIDNGSSDNCNFILTISQDTFDCSHIGDNTVTLTITDDSGNSSFCDAIVTISDLAQDSSVTISTPTNLICQNQSVTFSASPFDAGTNPAYQWQINGDDISGEITSTFTTTNLNNGDEVTVLMTSNASVCALEAVSDTIIMEIIDYNPPADAGTDITNTVCTNTTVNLTGSSIVGSGTVGLWTVTSGQTSGFSFSDDTSPTSTFTGDIGETYELTWSINNPDPCPDSSDSVSIKFIGCSALDFDGVDDNITFRDNYNFTNDFTIELWMKSEVMIADIQTIISKREANDQIDGYDLRLVDNYVSFNWNSGMSMISPFQIITNQWHHIAVTFESGTYTLYIDGIEMNSASGALPISNSVDCIMGAMDQTLNPPFKPLNYFNGGMDELRIWDVALDSGQIRTMMNQEIVINSGSIIGASVPMEIIGLNWNDLNGYYQMNQSNDIMNGSLISSNSNSIDGLLRYMTTLQPESAPLPYESTENGSWNNSAIWLNGSVQAIPNSLGIDGITTIAWNIVKSAHTISSGDRNITLLGLNIESNTLSIENSDPLDGQSLRITDYLILNGTLDLVGESQLLQDENSIVDYTGSGNLQRDQQGTSNLFNYNYWSSPVSNNGIMFNIESVLKDGSIYTNPQTLNWTSAHSATGSINPITLSSRWIYTFEDTPGADYFDWVLKGQNSDIDVGLGFTMKGSGVGDPLTDVQNYVFMGKPNNGDITIPILSPYQALVGNPYPSALDAYQFIVDNGPSGTNAIDGPLYFWEHSLTNNSHILSEYEGGYATYSLSGGLAAVTAPSEIEGLGGANKIPGRFVPIAQGFYVTSSDSGGEVLFNNGQRQFVKESDGNSLFLRSNQESSNTNSNSDTQIQRVRLKVKSPENAKRPLLLAFTPDDMATDGIDFGYDAENTEDFPNDASFMIEDRKYVIQGVGHFDIYKQYLLGLFLSDSGTVEIELTALENFETDIDVYIYDAITETSFQINTYNYTIHLNAGNYTDRFFITFQPSNTLSNGTDPNLKNVIVNYLYSTNEIYIRIPEELRIQNLQLLNILGQKVQSWNQYDINEVDNEIRIPVKNISEGTYILKLETNSNNSINKKILIKY